MYINTQLFFFLSIQFIPNYKQRNAKKSHPHTQKTQIWCIHFYSIWYNRYDL